jgi:hypothetical protein
MNDSIRIYLNLDTADALFCSLSRVTGDLKMHWSIYTWSIPELHTKFSIFLYWHPVRSETRFGSTSVWMDVISSLWIVLQNPKYFMRYRAGTFPPTYINLGNYTLEYCRVYTHMCTYRAHAWIPRYWGVYSCTHSSTKLVSNWIQYLSRGTGGGRQEVNCVVELL